MQTGYCSEEIFCSQLILITFFFETIGEKSLNSFVAINMCLAERREPFIVFYRVIGTRFYEKNFDRSEFIEKKFILNSLKNRGRVHFIENHDKLLFFLLYVSKNKMETKKNYRLHQNRSKRMTK